MDSVDLEVIRSAVKWAKEGHKATLGTVTHTWGSAPRPVGAMLVIRDDGHVMGSVSGGCVEDDLIDKVKANMLAADKPETATYGVTQEQANRYGLPCGGTLQLVFEPVSQDSRLEELLATIERHEMVARSLDMNDQVIASLSPRAASARRASRTRLCCPSKAGFGSRVARFSETAGTASRPLIRNTSSTMSASPSISPRQEGGTMRCCSPVPSTSNPSAAKISRASRSGRSSPPSDLSRE